MFLICLVVKIKSLELFNSHHPFYVQYLSNILLLPYYPLKIVLGYVMVISIIVMIVILGISFIAYTNSVQSWYHTVPEPSVSPPDSFSIRLCSYIFVLYSVLSLMLQCISYSRVCYLGSHFVSNVSHFCIPLENTFLFCCSIAELQEIPFSSMTYPGLSTFYIHVRILLFIYWQLFGE